MQHLWQLILGLGVFSLTFLGFRVYLYVAPKKQVARKENCYGP